MEGVKVGMVSHDPHKSPLLTSGVISSSTSCTKTKGANHWFITIPNRRQYRVPKATRGNSSSNHHLFWSCGINSNGEMIHDALLALQGLVKIGKTAQTCNTGQASVTLRCAILSQSQVDDSVWCLPVWIYVNEIPRECSWIFSSKSKNHIELQQPFSSMITPQSWPLLEFHFINSFNVCQNTSMPCMSRSNFRVSPCAGSVHSKSPWISSAVKYLTFPSNQQILPSYLGQVAHFILDRNVYATVPHSTIFLDIYRVAKSKLLFPFFFLGGVGLIITSITLFCMIPRRGQLSLSLSTKQS